MENRKREDASQKCAYAPYITCLKKPKQLSGKKTPTKHQEKEEYLFSKIQNFIFPMERHKNLPVNFSVQQPGGLELTEALCLELDFILLKTIMEPLLWFLGNYISLETKSKMKKQTEAHKR